jgi:ABC-type multidrug transport system fused ATPase/permease subunit
VILDEASSRLDPLTETLIGRAVDLLIHGRTAIIIAHHLETIQKTDQILILDNGSVDEYGERKSLMNDPFSKFSRLLQIGLEEVLV